MGPSLLVKTSEVFIVVEEVRKPGFEPGSQPWQGYILATILLPLFSKNICKGYKRFLGWSGGDDGGVVLTS